MKHPLISTIEWFDPQEEMPVADHLVMIADRLGCICFASWDDHKGKWFEQVDTPHGSFSYSWQERSVHVWAHIPDVPAKEETP